MPSDPSVDLNNLSQNFNKKFLKKIPELMNKTKDIFVNLTIPKFSRWVSEQNYFFDSKPSDVSVKTITYFDINSENSALNLKDYFRQSNAPEVIVDGPYIAYIYDIEREMFLFKIIDKRL